MKYSQEEYILDKEEYDKINTRKSTFIKETGLREDKLHFGHTPWITIITTEGVAKGKYSEMTQCLVKLDDLFYE
ncbi:MAG: hypothetical protein IKH26_13005 [Bacteroidaceae bacterium]|nr:hypothetical protein [Bacteroidaceae bacterium]